MAAVTIAAADDERAEGGLGEDAGGDVVWKSGLQWVTVHFSGFIAADCVDLFSEKRRQGEEVVQIADAEEVILIAVKFVGAVSAETKWTAQEKLGHRPGIASAEGGAAFHREEKGRRAGDRFEILQLGLHGGEAFGRAGTGVEPAEGGFSGITAARDDRIIAVVYQEMEFEPSCLG